MFRSIYVGTTTTMTVINGLLTLMRFKKKEHNRIKLLEDPRKNNNNNQCKDLCNNRDIGHNKNKIRNICNKMITKDMNIIVTVAKYSELQLTPMGLQQRLNGETRFT